MNKQCYRVIFSRQLQRMVVVSELAKRHNKVLSEGSGASAITSAAFPLKTAVLAILLTLGCVTFSLQAEQIIVDRQAPGNQRPTVTKTANGLPQINIQTPSAGGVSHNKYTEFNVSEHGAILNNSYDPAKTELAGWVNGNQNLLRGEAKIILNEVNGTNLSQLNGYLEVAGKKAQVVIANPAGIACDGCGFINANRVTLTTGLPQWQNGQLTGYQVNGGNISFSGNGLDNRMVDYTDLIARSVQLNAGIWAKELDITTGLNRVSADHSQIEATAGTDSAATQPQFALDLSALGGMYAGKIRLIGTEQGVGVRNAGVIGTSAGDLVLTTDGKLTNSGTLNSTQQLTINSRGGLSNSGVLYAKTNNRITTADALLNSGTIAAGQHTQLSAAQVTSSKNSLLAAGLIPDSTSLAAGTLSIESSGQLNAFGQNLSGGSLTFNAQKLDLSGSETRGQDLTWVARQGITLTGANVHATGTLFANTEQGLDNDNAQLMAQRFNLSAKALSNVDGRMIQTGKSDLNLKFAGDLDNRGGLLLSQGNLSIQSERLLSNTGSVLAAGVDSAGKLGTAGDLTVTTVGDLQARGQTLAAGDLTLTGRSLDMTQSQTQANAISLKANQQNIDLSDATLIANQRLSVQGAKTLRSDGAQLSAKQISLGAQALSNVGGQIIQQGSDDFVLTLPGYLDNRDGVLLSQGNMVLQADKLTSNNNSLMGAGILSDGSLAQHGNLSVNTTQALMAQGQNLAAQNLTFSGSLLDLTGSQTQANTITLTAREGTLSTRDALVISRGALSLNAASNAQQQLDNQGGKLYATTLTLMAGRLNNQQGEIAASGDLALKLQSDFTHQAGSRLTAGQDLTFNTTGALINQYKLEAGRNLSLTAKRIDNDNDDHSSAVLAEGNLTLTTPTLSNGGTLYAKGAGTLTIADAMENRGTLFTEQSLTLTGGENLTNYAALQTRGNLAITLAGDLLNTGTLYTEGQQLQLTVKGDVDNQGRIQATQGTLTLTNGGDLLNSGNLYAKQATVNIGKQTINDGMIYTAGDLQWQNGGSLHNSGTLAALGDNTLTATTFTGEQDSLLAAGLASDGKLSGEHSLTLTTQNQLTSHGKQLASGALSLNATTLALSQSTTQAADIILNASKGEIDLSQAMLSATGRLAATTTQRLRTDQASLQANAIELNAATLSNVAGKIAQTGNDDFTLSLEGELDNRQGMLLSQGNLTLDVKNLVSNSQSLLGAGVQTSGKMRDQGNLTITTQQNLLAQGQNAAAGALQLTGKQIDLSGSQTHAANITLTAKQGDVNTQNATLTTPGTLRITAATNSEQQLNNQRGTLAANNIELQLGQLNNLDGKISAASDMTLKLQSDFKHVAQSSLQIGRDFTLETTGDIINQAELLVGGKLSTLSQNLTNTSSLIAAEMTLQAKTAIINSGPNALIGATDSQGTLALLAPVIENRDDETADDSSPSTTILGMGNVILAGGQTSDGDYLAAEQISNISALIESGKDMLINAKTFTNSRRILTVNDEFVDDHTTTGKVVWTEQNPNVIGGRYIEPPHGGERNSGYLNTSYGSTFAYNSIDQISPEAQLLVGGNLYASGSTLQNYWSKISAQGTIDLTDATLDQDSWRGATQLLERRTSSGFYHYRSYKGELWVNRWGPEVIEQPVNTYASSFTASTLTGSGTTLKNGTDSPKVPTAQGTTGKTVAVEFNGIKLTLPTGGLYKANTAGGEYQPQENGEFSLQDINQPKAQESTGGNYQPGQPGSVENNGLETPARRTGGYLVETHPAFADLNQWRGSDAYFAQLQLDPDTLQKRLGDNAYEQKLVRDQVLALTGKTVTGSYGSEQAQFEQMFAAGAAYSQALNLAPGASLSAEQVAALTSNVVIMELHEVAGEQVWVPVVYLAGIKPGDLYANGALIAANNIQLTNMAGFTNSGAINASGNLQLGMAQDVTLNNLGGLLSAGNTLALSTVNTDINLIGAQLTAGNLSISSGRDLNLRTASEQLTSGIALPSLPGFSGLGLGLGLGLGAGTQNGWHRTQTLLGPEATITVAHNASITTQGDLNQQGARLTVGENLQVSTGGDWVLDTVERRDTTHGSGNNARSNSELVQHTGSAVEVGGALTAKVNNLNATGAQITADTVALQAENITLNAAVESLHVQGQSSSDRHKESSDIYDEQLLGSAIQAKGDLNLKATQNITLNASEINSEGTLRLAAGGDINLLTQQEQHNAERMHTRTKDNVVSSKMTREVNKETLSLAVGSQLSGNNVVLNAGNDLTVQGSVVAAEQDVVLKAQNNVTVEAATNTSTYYNLYETKSSGLITNGGLSFTLGKQSSKSVRDGEEVTQSDARSMIGTAGGNVIINAGNQATLSASDVIAGRAKGDTEQATGHIDIKASDIAVIAGRDQINASTHQESKSSGITVTLKLPFEDTVRNVKDIMNDKSDNSVVSKVKAVGVEAAAMALDAMGEVKVSAGSSRSSSDSKYQGEFSSGSQLAAAGNVQLTATGNNGNGDMLISGSTVNAGAAVILDAKQDVQITSATDQETYSSKSQSSGWSVTTLPSAASVFRATAGGGKHGNQILPGGMERSKNSGNGSETHQQASVIQGSDIYVNSQAGSIDIHSSELTAVNDLFVSAIKGDVTVSTAQETAHSESSGSNKVIGTLSGDGYSSSVGYSQEKYSNREDAELENSQRSQLTSLNGNLAVQAGGDLTLSGSDIRAGQSVALSGENILMDAGQDSRDGESKSKQSQYGVTASAGGWAVEAAKTAESAARNAENHGDDRLTAIRTAQSAVTIAQGVITDSSVVKAKVQLTVGTSSQESNWQNTQTQGTTINAGEKISLNARNDISGQGVQIAAKQVSLDAGRDIVLNASEETKKLESDSKGSQFGLGVGFGFGGTQNGFTIEVSASQQKGQEDGQSQIHTNSVVQAKEQLTINSGRDTTLQGAELEGNRVVMNTGRDLTLSSVQDTSFYESKSSSSGASLSLCVPPICAGVSSVSVNVAGENIKHEAKSVINQSAIRAGEGGFDINVGNHTQLDGSVIASKATADKNQLETGTLGWTEIQNKSKTTGSGYSVAVSASMGGNQGSDSKGAGSNGGSSNGAGSNGAASNATTTSGGGNQNVVPMISTAQSVEEESGTTSSAISEGTLVIRDQSQQQQDITELSHDTENAHHAVDITGAVEKVRNNLAVQTEGMALGISALDTYANYAEKQAKQSNAALAQRLEADGELTGKTAEQREAILKAQPEYRNTDYGPGSDFWTKGSAAVGLLAGALGGNLQAGMAAGAAPLLASLVKEQENPFVRTALHGIVAAALTQLSGGSSADGIKAGAVGAITASLMTENLVSALYGKEISELTPDEKRLVSNLVSIAGGVAGFAVTDGNVAMAAVGANTARVEVENNSLGVGSSLGMWLGKTPDCDTECKAKLAGDVAKGNAIVSAEIGATAGLGVLPKAAQITAAIGGGANVIIQYGVNGEVNYTDALIASWVGAITSNTGLLGTVGWNATGGAISSYIKGDDPLQGGVISGAASGVGYGIGKVFQGSFDKLLNQNFKNYEWVPSDVGLSITKPAPLSPIPGVVGNIFSSGTTEIISNTGNQWVKENSESKK